MLAEMHAAAKQHCSIDVTKFVFDALDPARSRPEAAAEVIGDFLKRGDGFLVSEQDDRLFP